MRRRLVIAAGAAGALLALLFLWQSNRPASERAPSDGAAVTSNLAGRKAARERGLVDTSPILVSGVVVDAESGSPIANATVAMTLRRIDGGVVGRGGSSPEPLIARTDSSGHFELQNLSAGNYSLSASAAGYKPGVIDGMEIAPGTRRDDLELRLRSGGHTLSGVVSDVGGGPVPQALVRAKRYSDFTISSLVRAPFSTVTDAQGRYGLTLEDGTYEISVLHPDYRTEKGQIAMDGRDQHFDMTMTPGAVIEGVVLRQSDDEPVAGALVSHFELGRTGGFTLSGVALNGAAETDAEGRFALRGLGSGAFELRAVSPNTSSRQPTVVELGIAETVTDVVVYVDTAYKVSGFVVSRADQDKPEPGVLVGAYRLSPGAVFAAADPSASDGYFEIHGVQPGSYTVGAAGEERVPNFFGEALEVVDRDVTDVVVKVESGYTLTGRVEPPTEATVRLSVDLTKLNIGNVVQAANAFLTNTHSDPNGNFTLRGVSRGDFTVFANTADGREGRIDIRVDGDRNDLVVSLEERGSVAGIVLDARGRAVEGANVEIHRDEENELGALNLARTSPTVTGIDGRFRRLGLEEGKYDVTVHDDGQLAWAGKQGEAAYEPVAVTIAGESHVDDLSLSVETRDQTITGTVLGPDGAPVTDAWVTARHLADDFTSAKKTRRGPRRGRTRAGPLTALTDEKGQFRIEDLREGRYSLSAEGLRGGARGELDEVRAGTNVTIALEPLAEIAGRVTAAGNPVQEYAIEVSGPSRRRSQVSAKDGRYRLPRLEAGTYLVTVISKAGKGSGSVTMRAGETGALDLTLAAYGAVFGTLVDGDTDEPLAGYPVFAIPDQGGGVELGEQALRQVAGDGPRTDEQGRFRVDRLGEGPGQLVVIAPNQSVLFAPSSLSAGAVATRSFKLGAGEELDLGTIQGKLATPTPAPPDE